MFCGMKKLYLKESFVVVEHFIWMLNEHSLQIAL